MTFFLFTIFLWLAAMFHLWDHRRFEADLRLFRDSGDAKAGDFRTVATPARAAGVALRRAFLIRGRQDVLRYGAPVAVFCLWLLALHSWLIAAAYAALIIVKWFAVTTVKSAGGARYRLYLAGHEIFSGSLDED